ncbi:S-adenosyl-L-methionine-dependent methyltransferase [Xylogone sp. PMI_703]|nr:S-adenosyl-L-methionine-dependent methyltransferase [Xylogone sp. PMI_703]
MSAPQIPNLLSLRGSRGRGRGRARGGHPANSLRSATQTDETIQGTDTDAAVSRLSAVNLGYLEDRYANHFVSGPPTRRLPIINRGTYTRTSALDLLINSFLSSDPSTPTPSSPSGIDTQPQIRQIISLGAGSDTRYFRIRDQKLHQHVIYHEFDFPRITEIKYRIVQNSPLLRSQNVFQKFDGPNAGELNGQASEWGYLHTADGKDQWGYICHPLDLRNLTSLPSLQTLRSLRGDIPTLIISECCLCYLEVDTARDVIKWFCDKIPSAGIILYEPIGSHDSFGQMMVANLAARNIVMPTVQKYKTLDDQKERLAELGFGHPEGAQKAVSIEHIWNKWIPDEEKRRVNQLEGLDEVEEWELLAKHYGVVWGWTGGSEWSSWEGLPVVT